MNNHHTVFTAAAALLALSLGTPLLADVNNIVRVSLSPNSSGGSGPVDNIVSHPGVCDSSGSATGGFNSSGSGTAHTTYGFMRLSASAAGTLNASASGEIRDVLTFTSPGIPTGTAGTVTYSVTVGVPTSFTANSGSSQASWQLRMDIGGGAYDLGAGGHTNSPDIFPSGYAGDAFTTYTATGSFQYGFPTQLYLSLSGGAQAAFSANGPGAAGCSNLTLTWGGITSVTVGGTPIPTYTVTSESGTNWGGAINPCPADLGSQGGVPGPDGLLDNNDFVVFINYFFAQNPQADMGVQGGTPGHDGLFDNNDFVVFISAFFDGC